MWGEEWEEEKKGRSCEFSFWLVSFISSGYQNTGVKFHRTENPTNFLSTRPKEGTEKRLDSFPRSKEKKEKKEKKRKLFHLIPLISSKWPTTKFFADSLPTTTRKAKDDRREEEENPSIDFLNFLYYLFDQMYSGSSSSDRSLVMKGSNSNRCCWWTNIVCTDYCTSGGGHSIKGKNKDLLLFTPSTYSSFRTPSSGIWDKYLSYLLIFGFKKSGFWL